MVDSAPVLWVRVGVENAGKRPAIGCVGRMIGLMTDGEARRDVDTLQLRWAGLPRSRAFDPMTLRSGQTEFLDVVILRTGERWRILTFEDLDFDPGFSTELAGDSEHRLPSAVFADNAKTTTRDLIARVHPARNEVDLRLA